MIIPNNLQGVLWSKSISKLDFDLDKNYIIHQVLSSGTWDQVRWLFKKYGRETIKETFLEKPSKNYTEKTFNLFANVIFGFDSKIVNKKDYVKDYPRVIKDVKKV